MENNEDLSANQQLSKNEIIEKVLSKEYDFRFNTVKSRTEYRKKSTKSDFKTIDKYALHSIWRELYMQKLSCTPEVISSILFSSFSPRIDPIKEYFLSLIPSQNGAIEALAKTVSTTNSARWLEYFTRWIVGVTANNLCDDKCLNHTCLTLTGDQGALKTSFLELLNPMHNLGSGYLFTGSIDVHSKDMQSLMSEYMLINIDDQLKSLNLRDVNMLKTLITLPKVKYRRPYDIFIEEYPHRASFMASVNGIDFLCDESGSRRFLSFQVVSIDFETAKSININSVYENAMYLFNSGFRYWFNSEEIIELNINNKPFHVQTTEYELLIKMFMLPDDSNNTNIEYLTNTEILNLLQAHSTKQLDSKRLGEALKNANFVRVSKRFNGNAPAYCYGVIRINP